MKAILNHLKPNMRRLLALSLACLMAASVMSVFTLPAAAAPAVTGKKVWKWKRVNSESDLKALFSGNNKYATEVQVPIYLCWETPNGESYVLQGMNGGLPNNLSDGFAYFYRNGSMNRYSSYTSEMPEVLAAQFKKYLQEKYPDKVKQAGGIDYFFVLYGQLYIDAFYKDVVKDSKAAWATSPAAKRFFADDGLCNRTMFLMMSSTAGFPKGIDTSSEKGLLYGAETFYTDTNASDISMTLKSDLSVAFKCGKNSLLYQPGAISVQNELVSIMGAGLGWWELDASKLSEGVYYTLVTSDTKNDRAQYTDAGKVQLVQTAQNRTCGLCFDEKYLDVLAQYDEKKPTYFSNFTMYYGVYSEIAEVDGDYAVKKGTTWNLDNNMTFGEGTHITVEPGAVVTVTGVLQNKGTIENCGTIVVNENSAIVNMGEGAINCYGNSVEFSGLYYRKRVELATREYQEKYDLLAVRMKEEYSIPLSQIETAIYVLEFYMNDKETWEGLSIEERQEIGGMLVQANNERARLINETRPLREEFEYFENDRDKIIRDLIAAYKQDELSEEGAVREYEKKLAEIETDVDEMYTKPLAAIDAEIKKLRDMANDRDIWGNMTAEERADLAQQVADRQNERTALIEATASLLAKREEYVQNREQLIEEIYAARGADSKEDTSSYTDCSGDLIVLQNGAVVFDEQNEQPLNMSMGATMLNAGTVVLPRGFVLSSSEIHNTSTGHIFTGFLLPAASYTNATVSNPGTKNATMSNLKTVEGITSVATGEYFINNEGTIIVHGAYSFQNSDKNVSGMDRVFSR